ncbi:hypothetical protein Q3G72_018055 [Acer saccharum]|nr:hypothetical protein Q3G72_018055 [Acer saccharum]
MLVVSTKYVGKEPGPAALRNFSCCLRGFEPKNMEEWSRGNWTNGCVRKRPLPCERINQTGEVAKENGFLKLEMMKVPYFAERSPIPVDNCSEHCLNNCSCIAYAFDAAIGCMTWTGSLIDIKKFPVGGSDLYIRLARSELEKKDNKVVVIVPVVAGIITCTICTFFLWRWISKHKALKDKSRALLPDRNDTCSVENLNEVELQDLPLFYFEKIFGGNEDQADTIRVVGTYGYMSPEYVIKGRFSEKSDVFSFGVLLLEIVSGRRNTSFYHDAESLSLLGYAWKLWNENNIVALIDQQPAFTERWNAREESSQQSQKRCSINYVTVTVTEGIIEDRYWVDEKNNWEFTFRSWKTDCDVYGWCGAFGSCNPDNKPICSCLRGFEPKNIQEWNRRNWTNGCVRKRPLLCERINKTGEVGKEDGFLKLETMKLPYFVERSSIPVTKCREHCFNNCSCIAYAYDAGIGCMTWTGSLVDINKFPSGGGADLYIRLSHSELGEFHDVILLLLC